MKKLIFFICIPILIIFSLILIGFNFVKPNGNLSIEMIAFNSLTKEEQDLIPVSPKDSIVEKVTVSNEIKSYLDNDYDEDQVYSVTFNKTETDTLGELTIFVSLDKETVVGKAFTK